MAVNTRLFENDGGVVNVILIEGEIVFDPRIGQFEIRDFHGLVCCRFRSAISGQRRFFHQAVKVRLLLSGGG